MASGGRDRSAAPRDDREPTVPIMLRALVAIAALLAFNACAPASAPSPSPVPTLASASPSPTASRSAAGPEEDFADRLADALQKSDYAQLQRLMLPSGWTAAFVQSSGLPKMTPADAIAWLRSQSPGGSLQVQATARPLMSAVGFVVFGDLYFSSVWSNFSGAPRRATFVVLKRDGESWYWSGALYDYK